MMGNLRFKKLMAVMGLAALGGWTSIAAQPAASDPIGVGSTAMVALHPAVVLRNGDKAVGPLATSQPMHVVLTLKLRNERELDQYIAKPGFRPLTSGQFQMLYAPTAEQAQAVVDYLTNAGFNNVKIAANNALVEADGRADTVQAAFHASLVHVKTYDGRDAFANNSAVQIPTSLQDVVHAVLGVQNVDVAHVFARYHDPIAAHAMATQSEATGSPTGHQPSDFPSIYGASGMPKVTSVPVGSISAGPMTNVLNDLKSVDPGVTVTLRGDTGVGNGTGKNSGDAEWDLDSQNIIAFTGVQQYYFYVANSTNDADLETAIAQVVSENVLKAIDFSLGECEINAQSDGTAASNDTTFKQAVAQGQTFFVAAGDLAASECTYPSGAPSWPASSQYVTAVGGTELYTSPNTTWQSETVWNNANEGEGTTGGSPSTFEPIPSWQRGVSGITNQTYRGVPDIAFDASPDSGSLITVDGVPNRQYGGTSLAAPLAVGMWARVLQADGISLGFASPVIYNVAHSWQELYYYAGPFHDVLYGSNDGYSAGPGWDYTSGWGSVIVSQFASQAGGNSGSPVVSFATLPALQATTPIPGSTHIPGDFNGDGTSDILWFNPSLSQVGYWTMTATVPASGLSGGVVRTGLSTYNVTPGYFVGAVGDFNGDGYADLVFTSANRDLWLWTNNQHGGWTSTRINNASYPSQWQLIGAGDVDGDGHDDLLWLDPSECKFGYWTMNGATVTAYHTFNVACGYYPMSIGYYTTSNRLSIVWTSAANELYMWDSTGTGFRSYEVNIFSQGTRIVSFGGGYQGQGVGVVVYAPIPGSTDEESFGMLFSRTFDSDGYLTDVQWNTNLWSDIPSNDNIASAGYLIAGNGINNTSVYDLDPNNMVLSTGGLPNGNTILTGNANMYPAFGGNGYSTGNAWSFPGGWWVVGALFNGSVAPPWQ